MRRAAATAVLMLWLQPLARAAGEAADKPSTKRDAGALREARGRVRGVDKERSQLTLESTQNPPVILQLDQTTTVFVDGHTSTLDEVREGSEVRAAYEVKRSGNRAQWVEVSKKEKKPGAAPESLPESPTPAPVAPAPATPTAPR
jgi:Cu/Ag efflux protein CusF